MWFNILHGIATGIFAGLYFAERRKRKLTEKALAAVQSADCDVIAGKNREITNLKSLLEQADRCIAEADKAIGYEGEGGDA